MLLSLYVLIMEVVINSTFARRNIIPVGANHGRIEGINWEKKVVMCAGPKDRNRLGPCETTIPSRHNASVV
jgi:hypothetical protein